MIFLCLSGRKKIEILFVNVQEFDIKYILQLFFFLLLNALSFLHKDDDTYVS